MGVLDCCWLVGLPGAFSESAVASLRRSFFKKKIIEFNDLIPNESNLADDEKIDPVRGRGVTTAAAPVVTASESA